MCACACRRFVNLLSLSSIHWRKRFQIPCSLHRSGFSSSMQVVASASQRVCSPLLLVYAGNCRRFVTSRNLSSTLPGHHFQIFQIPCSFYRSVFYSSVQVRNRRFVTFLNLSPALLGKHFQGPCRLRRSIFSWSLQVLGDTLRHLLACASSYRRVVTFLDLSSAPLCKYAQVACNRRKHLSSLPVPAIVDMRLGNCGGLTTPLKLSSTRVCKQL